MNCRLAELARKQSGVNTAPVNTEPVNTHPCVNTQMANNKPIVNTHAANNEPVVNTQTANTQPVNCLRCAALERRIAELEARHPDTPKRDRKAYMRDYMKRRRSKILV